MEVQLREVQSIRRKKKRLLRPMRSSPRYLSSLYASYSMMQTNCRCDPLQNDFQDKQTIKLDSHHNFEGTNKTVSNQDSISSIVSYTFIRALVAFKHLYLSNFMSKCSTFTYFVYIISLFNILNQEIYCITITKDFHPKQCDLDINTEHELIEPMVVKDSNLLGNSKIKNNTFIFDNIESMTSIPLADFGNCSNLLKIHFTGYGERYVIDLIKNKKLISDRYFKISKENVNRHSRHPDASTRDSIELVDSEFYKNHMFLNLHNFTTNNDHCHYHGFVNGNLGSISAISIVNNKLLSGFFHDGNDIYYLHANTTNSSTILTKYADLCATKLIDDIKLSFNSTEKLNTSTNLEDEQNHTANNSTVRLRIPRDTQNLRRSSGSSEDNYISHDPFLSNSSSLYVELLVVHDHSQYIEYKGNTSNIAERTMQIVNIMNAFYRQLNIFITLVGVVLWIEKDEIQLTQDGDATLTSFLKYRYEKLLPKYHHDNAQLITSTSFNGSVVGKALKGPICTHEHSGGVNTDHSHSSAIVAVTLAHELGHNFGMEHDEEDKCKCPDEKCIMSSSSSTVHPKHWSSCSVEYLEDARKHGLLDCLINKPEKIFGPICGNGFIEEGEDCDTGEPVPTFGTSKSRKGNARCTRGQDCDLNLPVNPCCDRQTCKFVRNATCAQGPCCNLSSCSVYNATEIKVCRSRQSECDLEEVCDGKSEFCPDDVYYHDGLQCGPTLSGNGIQYEFGSASYNRSKAYCYNGKCSSHESQCQLLWGPSGSVSKDICYEQNVHGNTSGNCGFNRRDKIYDSCEQEDAICGMLHCVHNQPSAGDSRKTGKLGYGFESASILTVSFFVMSNHAKIYCNGAIIDAGSNVRDPGLVPNGAACGDEKMCLNQKCVPVYDVVYKNWCPSDCSGNGICDNTGVCHCFDGTIGTSCYQFFGANFHLSILLYMIMFFVPVVALIVYTINHYMKEIKIWWYCHRRKIALRDKQRDTNKQRKSLHELGHDRLNLTISEPIPLSQHNNINRPFYEPSFDPWDESGQESGKALGFRLEPIKKEQTANKSTSILSSLSSQQTTDNLKPVRAAPPPPIPNQQPIF